MRQFLIAFDQMLNTLVGGYADESLSSHAWRMERDGKPWGFLRRVIDGIMFLDPSHCEQSYLGEKARLQLPPEFRK